MIEQLKILVSEYVNVNEAEWSVLSESLEIKEYKRGELFLKEGDFCNYVGFVNKGLFNFYHIKGGIKHIRGFFFSNNLISNYPCFLQKNKSEFYIEAMEDSSITFIHRDALLMLHKELPMVQEFSRVIVESLYLEVSAKYESFFIKTAEERYMDFVQGKPELTKKIPQYMIASYLGITPEGLSRIKKRIS